MTIVVLLGRILFSTLFLMSGISHFTQRAGMVAYAKSSGAPAPEVTVPLTGLMLLLGGLSVLLGVYPRIGAWLLVLFLIPTAFYIHRFWGIEDAMMAANQRAHFMKNLALAGAALLIAYFGTGPLSLIP
jgi:putative oxidoreductase